jgi:FG-GAP repeat protein
MRTTASIGRVTLLTLSLAAIAQGARAQIKGDFNGDSRADLAIGLPSYTDGTMTGAGAVRILYAPVPGSAKFASSQLLYASLPDVPGDPEPDAAFGQAVAAADFNDDGFSDLAVGVPGRDVDGAVDAGAVIVFYGSPTGLTTAGSQEWTSNTPGVAGVSEAHDYFGQVLETVEYLPTGQGFLAIGVPYEDVPVLSTSRPPVLRNVKDAGAVTVLYFNGGLRAEASQEWTEESPEVPGSPAEGDHFGWALATGYFGLPPGSGFYGYAEGYDDYPELAIGVPDKDVTGAENAGAVIVLYGILNFRLTAQGSQWWDQDVEGVPGAAEAGARFGSALAGGNFSDDPTVGHLAIGVPGQDVDGYTDAGAVVVLMRNPYYYVPFITSYYSAYWTANTPGVPDACEMYDNFGSRLAIGDFNGDGRDDLAIGTPSEDRLSPWDPGWIQDIGAVTVLPGSASGLGTVGAQFWTQASAGIGDDPEEGDAFGFSLAVLDLDGDEFDDLIVGVPFEDLRWSTSTPMLPDVGGFQLLQGSDAGLRADGGFWGRMFSDAAVGSYGTVGRVLP